MVNTADKYKFYMIGIDSRDFPSRISLFSEELVETIKIVNEVLGNNYFDNDKKIKKIYLLLNCDELEIDGEIVNRKSNQVDYMYSIDKEIVKNDDKNHKLLYSELKRIIVALFRLVGFENSIEITLTKKLDVFFTRLQ